MNIPKEILEDWAIWIEMVEEENLYGAGFEEGYRVAIDEGSSLAYKSGWADAEEEFYNSYNPSSELRYSGIRLY